VEVHIVLIPVTGDRMKEPVVFLHLVVDMIYHLVFGLANVVVHQGCRHLEIVATTNRKLHHMDDKWIEELIRLLKQ